MDKIIGMILEDYKEDNDIPEFARQVNNRYVELLGAGLIKEKKNGKHWATR